MSARRPTQEGLDTALLEFLNALARCIMLVFRNWYPNRRARQRPTVGPLDATDPSIAMKEGRDR